MGRWFTAADFKIKNPFYSWGLKDIPAWLLLKAWDLVLLSTRLWSIWNTHREYKSSHCSYYCSYCWTTHAYTIFGELKKQNKTWSPKLHLLEKNIYLETKLTKINTSLTYIILLCKVSYCHTSAQELDPSNIDFGVTSSNNILFAPLKGFIEMFFFFFV